MRKIIRLKNKDLNVVEDNTFPPNKLKEDVTALSSLITPSTLCNGYTNHYIKAATSENTRRAYRQDIRHFEFWGGKLPATSEDICRYLETFASRLNPRTLHRRLVALKQWHVYQGFPDPTQHPIIQKTMTGIHRVHGKPKAKAHALTLEELSLITTHLTSLNTLPAYRDNALLQIGFFGALRRSELVAIHHDNIHFHPEGIEILLPTSKTDPLHEGQYVTIPSGNQMFCPISALKTWLYQARIETGPIFRRLIGEKLSFQAITPLTVNHILKTRAKAAGISHYAVLSGHSLRRGFATSAAQSGATLQAIMRGARWKHPATAMEYIDAKDRFFDHAANRILNKHKESV